MNKNKLKIREEQEEGGGCGGGGEEGEMKDNYGKK